MRWVLECTAVVALQEIAGMSRVYSMIQRLAVFLALAVASMTPAHGQIRPYGRIGVDQSLLSGNDGFDYSSRTSVSGGIGVSIRLGGRFRFRPELLYADRGGQIDHVHYGYEEGFDVVFHRRYLSFPMLLQFQPNVQHGNVWIAIGPSLDVNTRAVNRLKSLTAGFEWSEPDVSAGSVGVSFVVGLGSDGRIAGIDCFIEMRLVAGRVKSPTSDWFSFGNDRLTGWAFGFSVGSYVR
jgi:hypothetical protein